MDPVKGTRVDSSDDLFAQDVPPGTFRIKGRYILAICPCGCGNAMNLPLRLEGDQDSLPNAWLWDGNEELPTLQPSIRDLAHCRFHGYLTAGTWTFAEDSGVKS